MHSVSNIQWSVNEAVGRILTEGERRLEADGGMENKAVG